MKPGYLVEDRLLTVFFVYDKILQMVRWVAKLSNGDVAEQDIPPWVEIEGERLPWARLCNYLAYNNLYIDELVVKYADNEWVFFKPNALFYSVENVLEVDNLLGEKQYRNMLHVAAHYPNDVEHVYIDVNEEVLVLKETTNEFRPIIASPSREEHIF